MRNAQSLSLLLLAIFAIFTFVLKVNSAKATVVICPEGYTCTPINQSAVMCPAGYTCEPINNSQKNSTVIYGTDASRDSCYIFTKNLWRSADGMNDDVYNSGSDVYQLQSYLLSIGYNIPSISSGKYAKGQVYDEDTIIAVKKYQTSKGIPSTGFVGPLTRASLNASCKTEQVLTNSSLSVQASYNKNTGKIDVSWEKYTGDFDYYQLFLGNDTLNRESQLNSQNIDKNLTSYSASVPDSFVDIARKGEQSSDYFFVKVNPVKNNRIGGTSAIYGKSNYFPIKLNSSVSTSPLPSNSPLASTPTVFARLVSANEDRVGTWTVFAPSSGNINSKNSDWKWVLNISVPSNSNLMLKRITIKHNISGEIWSTGYNNYLQNGEKLYDGYNEHPYPLVVVMNGLQLNKEYDQTLMTKPLSAGNNEFVLYGQAEYTSFVGGKIVVEFNDGTSVSNTIASSNIRQGDAYELSATPSPTPTNTPGSNCPAGYTCTYPTVTPTPTPMQSPGQPSVSFVYPRASETWNVGDTKNVSWSYANFNTTASGDKFVELQLLPQDGRAPVVLGTYTYPYSYQPLNIYTKTSTGRDAWLPGQYKLRIACKSTNIDGFRTCAETVPGYITIPPTPSPSPTTGSTIMQKSSGADLHASIWSAIEEYNRTR